MTIEKNLNGTELTVTITGRLDTTTAPQLEAEFKLGSGRGVKAACDGDSQFSSVELLFDGHCSVPLSL